MRVVFRIRVDDATQIPKISQLFERVGGESIADGRTLLISLPFEQPATTKKAYDEVGFAPRALLPDGTFEIEPRQRFLAADASRRRRSRSLRRGRPPRLNVLGTCGLTL